MTVGMISAHGFNLEHHLNLPCPLKGERGAARFALNQRLFEIHKHDVITARCQLHSLPRWQLQPLWQLAHAHHIAFHCHFVDFYAGRKVHTGGDQPVGLCAIIADGHETASHGRTGRCGTGIWMVNMKIASMIVVRMGTKREEEKGGDGRDSKIFHLINFHV